MLAHLKEPVVEVGSLSEDQWRGLCAAMYLPCIELTESVSTFQTRFEDLRSEPMGFSPERRFLLNRCLAGDKAAIKVREHIFKFMRRRRLKEPYAVTENLESAFYTSHQSELVRFRSEHQLFEPLDSMRLSPRHFERPTNLAAVLDEVMLPRLGSFGFAKVKATAPARWIAQKNVSGYVLQIRLDAGPRSLDLSSFVEVEKLRFSLDIADPFLYSAAVFPFWGGSDLRTPVQAFLGAFSHVAAPFFQAIDAGIARADRYLNSLK